MSSIMRCRSGLMGLSDIAKAPVSHGVEPHDLETGLELRVRSYLSRASPVPRRPYRASGLVLGSESGVWSWQIKALDEKSSLHFSLRDAVQALRARMGD